MGQVGMSQEPLLEVVSNLQRKTFYRFNVSDQVRIQENDQGTLS